MPRTGFDPQVHGFAFANHWRLTDEGRQRLPEVFDTYVARRRILGVVGLHLGSLGLRLLRSKLEGHLAPHYGLCGGMCFAALDFYRAALPLPRGRGADDQPEPGTWLYRYIWHRQLDSLVSDAMRFLVWLIVLSYVPAAWPFRGGAAWLLARSRREWRKLKASLDAGEPVPIGLVRDTRNVYENHQVLALGYDEIDQAHIAIALYDPNCPGGASTLSIEFGERSLDGREGCGAEAPLRGFFCEAYTPFNPADY